MVHDQLNLLSFNFMKKYFYLFISFIAITFLSQSVFGQGCVAVKNMNTCSMSWGEDSKGLQLSLNYRYFRSYKHFVGTEEQVERVKNGTEVINNDNSINLGASYTFNNRWSATVIVPYIFIDRSSLYEHLGNSTTTNPEQQRFHTQSQGIGDVRAIAYYNALGTGYHKGTLTLGLGVKLPTGNFKVKDDFHKRVNDEIVLQEGIVDQSIQLGDGGTGIITEVDFNHKLSGKFFGYASALYLFNPQNTNGVKRSANPTIGPDNTPIKNSNKFSVTDQYMVRAGARYASISGIQLSLGGRMECIPSKDLIGESEGFRRPGYIISVEPSAYYTKGQHTFGFNFPYALERNRTRSQIDIARGIETNPNSARYGKPVQGDAAFADWLLSVTYSYRLK
jgi:hypothetical protein